MEIMEISIIIFSKRDFQRLLFALSRQWETMKVAEKLPRVARLLSDPPIALPKLTVSGVVINWLQDQPERKTKWHKVDKQNLL